MPLYSTFSNKIKGGASGHVGDPRRGGVKKAKLFLPDYKRIGPHSRDIISIIFGSLLGEGDVEIKKDGTRITFFQEAMHVKYLLWLHNQLATAGYCNPTVPTIGKRLGKKGKVRKTIRFVTWTYTSFDWIYDLWYVNGVKVVPQSIGDYLTPLALAIWVMDSGVKASVAEGAGLKFTNCFSYSDCLLLVQVLHKNFGLKATIQSTGVSSQYRIYIPKESMVELRNIVGPFIIPEMKYKLLP
jgi:ubiquinol-cytochrome c reductase cytochrome b subunit